MALKIGDKVRFLNATGGGVVKRFVNKELVSVEEEDGFETPVLIRECVVIETVTAGKSTPSKTENRFALTSAVDKMPAPQVVETNDGDKLNIVLAFLPIDEKNIQTTDYEAYFVNCSNYFVQFNYLSMQSKGWILRHSATVEPNQQVFIEEFSKQDLNQLERICIQFTAFKQNKPFELKTPVSVEHRIDTVKFYKLHSFQENDFFEDKAMLLHIVKNDSVEQTIKVDPKELAEAMRSKVDVKESVKQINREKISNNILEIDLHAHELLDSITGLSNTEILKIQLLKFNETMKSHFQNKGMKIVFIHGKGEGVLRKAILDELKIKYKTCQFQDASFREYGFGATMITIK